MRKLIPLFVCFVIAGCASVRLQRHERFADEVVGLINTGEATRLAEGSHTPFILDGELIMLDRDVELFWANIIEAGFRLGPIAAVQARPVDTESFRQFASSREVEIFFQKYVSAKGSLILVEAGSARILLLVESGRFGRRLIVGFKGPEPL